MKTKQIELIKVIDELNERNFKIESQRGREAEILVEKILYGKN